MTYLPLLPKIKDRVNDYLAGMAARGFVVDDAMLREVCKTKPCDDEPAEAAL